jgi:choline dehydrogenase
MKATRRLMDTAAMRPYVAGERDPGPSCASDTDLMDFLRERGGIAYHPVGTCKMGSDAAVVDERLRVRGLEACASWTPRSCRPSFPATPTRRRS